MPASVHFLIGRAGAGKTARILSALKETHGAAHGAPHSGTHSVAHSAALFVPEQFTYETERALSRGGGDILGVQVLSVPRLRERIIKSQQKPYLSPQGRRMAIRRAAYANRGKLTVFFDAARRAGFAERMDGILSRCRQARLAPEYLREAAERLTDKHGADSPLVMKLYDIALIYEAVQEYLSEHYMDNEDAQDAVLYALPNSPLAGADIYFDGFEAMNGQMYAMLEVMMRVARSVTFSICMDPSPDARDEAVFAPERRIYERLRDMAASLGCTVGETALSGIPPKKDPALFRLERELFSVNPRPMRGAVPSITLIGAGDRIAEVEALADAVLRAAREGMRFRDMAVIAADMPAYAPLVQRAFALRGIPLFLDARKSMLGHPVVELLLSGLRAAMGAMHRPDCVRILKTGLAGVETDDAEAFENYCLQRGLTGGRALLSPFRAEYEAAERARLILIQPLEALREGMKAPTAGEKARAVYAYLEALHIEEQLGEEAERLRAQGRFALMEEHAQVWGILMEMLEQLYDILGAVEMGGREFFEIISEALSAYQVGLIPATADQVLFGDFHRTRSARLHALFLLGCNEGIMPAARRDDALIDDQELTACADADFPLWEGAAVRELEDRLEIYRALSMADTRLWLGFAYSDGAGEMLPSTFISAVKKLFPDLMEQSASAALPECENSGFLRLVKSGGKADALTQALRMHFQAHPVYGERLARADAFMHAAPTPRSLPAPLAKKLYGGRFYGSVSRVETYRACPYRYFLEHGLKIRPRREFERKKSDIGSFAHLALERFVRAVQEGALDFSTITREQVDEVLNGLFPICLDDYEDGLLNATPRARALSIFVVQAVRDTAWALCKSLSAGDFTPYAVEARFGAGGVLPPLALENGALLSGVIDRVDMTADGDFRVIDYKTGEKRLEYIEMYDGTNMQLPIYLAAASALGDPAGMYYQPVKAPVVDEDKKEEPEAALRIVGFTRTDAADITDRGLSGRSRVVRGLARTKENALAKGAPVLEGDMLHALVRFAVGRAADISAELMRGTVEARPVQIKTASVCRYCVYGSVCRFDARLPACRVRVLKSMKKEEFFEKIKGGSISGENHEMDGSAGSGDNNNE